MILSEPARKLLDQPLIGRISVIDEEGYPHTIPIWFIRDGDEVMFISSRGGRKIRSIQANPKGALTVGGDPYGSEGYLLKGEFAIEEDPGHRWLRGHYLSLRAARRRGEVSGGVGQRRHRGATLHATAGGKGVDALAASNPAFGPCGHKTCLRRSRTPGLPARSKGSQIHRSPLISNEGSQRSNHE